MSCAGTARISGTSAILSSVVLPKTATPGSQGQIPRTTPKMASCRPADPRLSPDPSATSSTAQGLCWSSVDKKRFFGAETDSTAYYQKRQRKLLAETNREDLVLGESTKKRTQIHLHSQQHQDLGDAAGSGGVSYSNLSSVGVQPTDSSLSSQRTGGKRIRNGSSSSSSIFVKSKATTGTPAAATYFSAQPENRPHGPPQGGLPLAADTSRADNSSCLDFSADMNFKEDHGSRPVIVCPTGHLFLEMFHPSSQTASDFLVTIAEPISRPEIIHEFQITVFSLYGAIGVGLQISDILENLNKFSKNAIPSELVQLLKVHGNAFGRVKLVLRDNKYFLETDTKEDLDYLLSNPTIAENRIRNGMAVRTIRLRKCLPSAAKKETGEFVAPSETVAENTGEELSELETIKHVYLFQVRAECVGRVKECALTELKLPLLSEYDFRRDQLNCTMDIALKPSTRIRYYQEGALRKMFSTGRARSGIIVLPCGAGKTLTGITAATTIRKSTMVLTSSSVAVDQWKRAFLDFTTIDPALVLSLTADQKYTLPEDSAVVLISTYTMMAYSGKRSAATERVLNQVRQREWGCLIFDEVQYAPAPAFRKINDTIKSHCKLGLTATLVREDELITDLQWLIGPKLYEANWLELQEAGYLAKVQVSEVWCPMTAEFFYEYLNSPHTKQRNLWVCNPNKLRVCEYLLRFHEARNDKIIVFSDNLFALKEVAFALKKPFISGKVGMQERMMILNKFKTSPRLNTIFLSKVGDNAIDIPCANVVIQISFNFASRRQEAQRLGRILRPKPKSDEDFNAFFYSLISKDTQEMHYADKRQQFIIDQGYAYKVLPMSVFPMENEKLLYDDPQRQRQLLTKITSCISQLADIENDDVVLVDSAVDMSKVPTVEEEEEEDLQYESVKRATLSHFAGGSSKYVYKEGGPLF